jgi:DNA adenine methylase
MKTFIRWQGNKSRYLKHILPLIPHNYKKYIEPFVGSGAVFLALQPTKWIINDKNKDLIQLWNILRRQPSYLINEIKAFVEHFNTLTQDEKLQYCKAQTQLIPTLRPSKRRACLWLLMRFCAFMGHILQNGKYIFPALEHRIYHDKKIYFSSQKYFDVLKNIHTFMKMGQGDIYCDDYKTILKKAERGDFVFLDPPYIEAHDYQFNYIHGERISHNILNDLYQQLKMLDSRGVKWMMTQADTPDVRQTFGNYNIQSFTVYRLRSKQHKNELIIRNYT